MNRKSMVMVAACVCAIGMGVWMIRGSLGSSRPTRSSLESSMHQLTTEDLITRRKFMSQQIEQAKASGPGPRPELLSSAEASLAELDQILIARGVDPNALSAPAQSSDFRRERP